MIKDTVKENPQDGLLGQPTTAAEKETKKEINMNNQRKQLWWHTSVIPALGKRGEKDFQEFKASLVYTEAQLARATQHGKPKTSEELLAGRIMESKAW